MKKNKNNFYNSIVEFIKDRFDKNEKYGLTLTLGIVVTFLFVYLFFGILRDIVGQDQINSFDIQILNHVKTIRSPSLTKLMLFITTLGKGYVIALAVFFLANIFIFKNKSNYLITLLVSVVFGQVIFVELIKRLIQRVRPEAIYALIEENSFSFPSGHSFVAVSFYGLLAFFVYRNVTSRKLRIFTILLGIALILLIGFSRIYLGVHYPTDVLASFVVGAAWLTSLITIFTVWEKFIKEDKRPLDFHEYIGIIAAGFFFIWLIIVYYFYKTTPIL